MDTLAFIYLLAIFALNAIGSVVLPADRPPLTPGGRLVGLIFAAFGIAAVLALS